MTTTATATVPGTTDPALDGPEALDLPYDRGETVEPTRRGRARWPLFGVVAGVAGYAGAMATLSNGVTEEDAKLGADVIDTLERGGYHVGFVLGLVSVGAMLVTAAGWRRWVERRAAQDLAGQIVPASLTICAAVNIIFTALTGSMALYLPDGMDHGWLSKEAMFVNFTLLDFGTLIGWWGAVVAALGVATLALRRNRVLPRWMGVVSVLLVIPPVLLAVLTGLPGLPGMTMPIWLVVISLGMVFSRTAKA